MTGAVLFVQDPSKIVSRITCSRKFYRCQQWQTHDAPHRFGSSSRQEFSQVGERVFQGRQKV